MAFSNGEKVMERTEEFIRGLFNRNRHQGLAIRTPNMAFPRMKYHEAMHKHGSDKPDLRIPDEVGFSSLPLST